MSSNIKIQRVCLFCGKEFTAQTTVTKYCSHTCSQRAYKQNLRKGKIEVSNKETKAIISKPIEELKAKPFLSISETSMLFGISKRTLYRIIDSGKLIIGKAGSRTIIRRSDIEELLFGKPQNLPQIEVAKPRLAVTDISECYNLTEIKAIYGVSETAIQNIIRRNEIPKIRKGKFVYVPKTTIDNILRA